MNVKITNIKTGQVIETTWRPVGKRSDNSSARGILSNIRISERTVHEAISQAIAALETEAWSLEA